MTNIEKYQLIEAIDYEMPSITLHDKNTDKETVVVEVETLKEFIRDFKWAATEGHTEAKKRSSDLDWEGMYFNLQKEHDRLLVALRTFEFIYGRKLDGIC